MTTFTEEQQTLVRALYRVEKQDDAYVVYYNNNVKAGEILCLEDGSYNLFLEPRGGYITQYQLLGLSLILADMNGDRELEQ